MKGEFKVLMKMCFRNHLEKSRFNMVRNKYQRDMRVHMIFVRSYSGQAFAQYNILVFYKILLIQIADGCDVYIFMVLVSPKLRRLHQDILFAAGMKVGFQRKRHRFVFNAATNIIIHTILLLQLIENFFRRHPKGYPFIAFNCIQLYRIIMKKSYTYLE